MNFLRRSSVIKDVVTKYNRYLDATYQGIESTAHHAGKHTRAFSHDSTNTKPTLSSIPFSVKALGFGGVIPFWAFSSPIAPSLPLHLFGDAVAHNAALMQIGYGATILSFLGGVHWGLAMTNLTPMKIAGQRYVWSVLPCLMAFPTVVMPVPHAAAIQVGLLGIVYLSDIGWARRGMLPPWYMKLRLPLTVLAASGLSMTAVAGS